MQGHLPLPCRLESGLAPAQILLSRHGCGYQDRPCTWLSRHMKRDEEEETGVTWMSIRAEGIRTATQASASQTVPTTLCGFDWKVCVARAHTHTHAHTQLGRCTHPRRPPDLSAPPCHPHTYIHPAEALVQTTPTQPKRCNLCSQSGEAQGGKPM